MTHPQGLTQLAARDLGSGLCNVVIDTPRGSRLLDVLVLADEPAFAGCVVPVRLIGVIQAEQAEKGRTVRNDRLVGVVETEYNRPEVRSLGEVSAGRLDEIEHFFVSTNRAEGR